MEINREYSCNIANYRRGRRDRIKYIVIHYVGAEGSAKNNAKYYKENSVGCSAHYFVGHASEDGAVYESVSPENCAWHCGSETGKYYSQCRNDSAIGIELCCHKDKSGRWYFDDVTVDKAVELTKMLMKKYGINANHVIRHYDVTHKNCPAPFVENDVAWGVFKRRLEDDEMTSEERIKFNGLVNAVSEIRSELDIVTEENKILKQAIGWDSDNKDEPALYQYNDDNITKFISKDGNEILKRLISGGKLSVDSTGAFTLLSKTALRLLIIQNRK